MAEDQDPQDEAQKAPKLAEGDVVAAFRGLAHFGPATAAKVTTAVNKIDVINTHPDKAAEQLQHALEEVTAATSKAHADNASKAGEQPGGTATVYIGHGQALAVIDRLRAAAGS